MLPKLTRIGEDRIPEIVVLLDLTTLNKVTQLST